MYVQYIAQTFGSLLRKLQSIFASCPQWPVIRLAPKSVHTKHTLLFFFIFLDTALKKVSNVQNIMETEPLINSVSYGCKMEKPTSDWAAIWQHCLNFK